jgi:hypothetical protein
MCRFSQTHTTAAESFVCEGKCFASEKRKQEKNDFRSSAIFLVEDTPTHVQSRSLREKMIQIFAGDDGNWMCFWGENV